MKGKITKICLLFAILVLAVLTIYHLTKYEVINVQAKETNFSALESTDAGVLAEGEIDPDTYDYHIDTGGQWEALQFNDIFIPMYEDYQVYCIEPGVNINNLFHVRYAEALELIGKQYVSDCVLEFGHAETPMEGLRTPAMFEPIGEAIKLPPAAAYIISDEPIGEWSLEKQKALHHLRDSMVYDAQKDEYVPADEDLIMGDGVSEYTNGPSIYDKEAVDYAEYDYAVRDIGLQPTDKTNIDGISIKVNTEAGEYTVGPFNIEYTNGVYGDIAFAGISEMTVVGYNKEGQEVRDDIEVEKIILKDTATGIYEEVMEPEYFEPDDILKVDETEQIYPEPGQDFQVVFKDPNEGLSEDDENRVTSVALKVKFKYMLAEGKYMKYKGTKYIISYMHDDTYNPHLHGSLQDYGCITTCYFEEMPQQWLIIAEAIRVIYEQELIIGKTEDKEINLSMDLGGHVWEDVPTGKESVADGKSSILSGEGEDRALPNIKVTLYTEDGELAKLLSDPNEEGISEEQVMYRINPTLTNANGNYMFEGLDPMKKYYVTFEYNGQIYLPTDYGTAEYNTDEWKVTSKGTEKDEDRNGLNARFSEIGSSPVNYQSTNSLSTGALVNGYNESFSQYDLMGFELNENGDYTKGTALIDCFYEINGGNIEETDTIQEGVISTKIKEYINENKEYPDDDALKGIYEEIAGGDEELLRKLQFVEDCKIESYTQPQGGEVDLYPVYDQFKINAPDPKYTTIEEAQNGTYDMEPEVIDGVTYEPIYPGQFFINQGLWRRQEVDLALRKDVAYAATRINGKTEVYKYNKREQMTAEETAELARLREIYEQDRTNTANYQAYMDYAEQIEGKYYWEIQLRMRDYNNYYAGVYERDLYPADYTYRAEMNGADASKELELYVTYKITVRNSSTSIVSQITEVVDYYDKDYEYIDNLSWVMYGGTSEISVSEDAYYNTINNLSLQVQNAKPINSNSSSKYGTESEQSGMEAQYNAVYIRGLEDRKLESGEEAYIYLTFKVKSDSNGPVILDDDNSLKQNYVEINGYTTYYKDGTALPNGQTKGSGDAAGIIDIDSTPGNLKAEDLSGEKYEKNFEDDTDRAKSIKVTLNNDAIRSINGTVWEDERTQDASNAMIGDGIRQDEIGIAGVTVELVEKLENGNEHVWQTLTTGADGKYEFKTDENANAYIIPGNYVVRFYYGNNNATVLTNSHGGSNVVSYNGQDFKSTIYQQGLSNYTEEYYNIQAADAFESNISDAKDSWERRQEVNGYSISNVTNHKAEVLASPYASEINETLINELIENTNMSAETAIIVFEGEYNRTKTDGEKVSNGAGTYLHGNDVNGNYTLNNLDFGLVERPKAQLELNKKVSNVKITLANGSTLFDTTADIPAADRKWLEGKSYNLINQMEDKKYEEYYNENHRYAYRTEIDNLIQETINSGLIEFNMDNELMQGATISVTYNLTVTNASETDYLGQDFYYKGTGASEMVTTSADSVLDYLANNLSYKEEYNIGWSEVESFEPGEVADVIANTDVNIVKTEGLAGELQPGESKSVSLILTQIMSSNNAQDDKAYDNIAEISAVSNTAGRRMAYSIQANQDPKAEDPAEVDTSKAEHIIVIPPTGIGEIVVYIALSRAVLAVIIVGIIFIKKKVLKK